ncbi:YlbF family regulator [Paenibacillus cremeus]|uniref:YlbF family regulator n=1 Tax=Paenibacillus cremeus TaxID=2163881 RepID=A0A559K9B9_9BACL|nr:YlbF family regulator [Paenibacillus cremeus]TVY08728.1 YlbF family regulator [Paenibacillus cremeus]
MAIMEPQSLDMSAVLMGAYELSDMITHSAETADYLYWKHRKDTDEQVQQLVRALDKKKVLFEETQRFGHYHPNYHEALDQVNAIVAQLDAIESVRRFKEAEQRLDDLLYQVSQSIAYAVSDTIKVPSNDPLASSGGCSSGGSCSGKCG